jgi:hypothetical protein
MSALLSMLGGGGAQAAEPEPEAGGFDLSALMGGAAPAAEPAEDEEALGGGEKDMLAKLLGGLA